MRACAHLEQAHHPLWQQWVLFLPTPLPPLLMQGPTDLACPKAWVVPMQPALCECPSPPSQAQRGFLGAACSFLCSRVCSSFALRTDSAGPPAPLQLLPPNSLKAPSGSQKVNTLRQQPQRSQWGCEPGSTGEVSAALLPVLGCRYPPAGGCSPSPGPRTAPTV